MVGSTTGAYIGLLSDDDVGGWFALMAEEKSSELYLHENYSGKLYYLQFCWLPVPDAFLRKSSFLLGAGVGLSQSKISYGTSKSYSYEHNPDTKAYSQNAIALLGTAEFNYFFTRYLSLGFGAEYRYAPVKIEPFSVTGGYYDLDESFILNLNPALEPSVVS